MLALVFISLFVVCQLAAASTDLLYRRISNKISLVLILGFLAVMAVHWQGFGVFSHHLLVAFGVFTFGIIVFALGGMGGGDVKLLMSTCLWWQLPDLMMYIVVVGLSSLVLLVFIRLGPSFLPLQITTHPSLSLLFKKDKYLPYGIVLATGALATLPHSEIFQAMLS